MELQGKRAAVLVEQMYQELEVWYPVYRLREAGCKVTLVGPEAGQTYPSKLGYPVKSDKAARDVSADDFDILIIPGGYAPDHIRRCEAMIQLTSDMAERGYVAQLVFAGLLLIALFVLWTSLASGPTRKVEKLPAARLEFVNTVTHWLPWVVLVIAVLYGIEAVIVLRRFAQKEAMLRAR